MTILDKMDTDIEVIELIHEWFEGPHNIHYGVFMDKEGEIYLATPAIFVKNAWVRSMHDAPEKARALLTYEADELINGQ